MRKPVCPGATPISDYPIAQWIHSVSALDIIAFLRADIVRVGAAIIGFAPEDVGTHSLCTGGTGVPDQTLMTIDQWCSIGFMVYIQQHI